MMATYPRRMYEETVNATPIGGRIEVISRAAGDPAGLPSYDAAHCELECNNAVGASVSVYLSAADVDALINALKGCRDDVIAGP